MSLTDTSSARLSLVRETGTPPVTPATPEFLNVPFTGESLSEKLTSAQSAAMRDDRQFASSRLVRGESAGDVSFEIAYGTVFDEILSGVLQATPFPATPASSDSDDMVNDKERTFFTVEKRLEAESGFQYQRFQSCQISTLSLDVQANALVSASMGIVGLASSNATNIIAGATYTDFDLDDQMDTNSAVLDFKEAGGATIDVTAQSFSLSLDNQMRGQQAVGYFYNAGNASGRFKAMITASVYFRNQELYNKFINNEGIQVELTLQDTAGNTYKFAMANTKTTSYDISAGGADQDLVASIEMQAFPAADAGDKTLTVTRFTA